MTTLYFETDEEDDLRKVGLSKERRVDSQVRVGMLVDRSGFPLQVGCWEGNKVETRTIISLVTQSSPALQHLGASLMTTRP
ncbi:hypothetical protein [Actinomyces trachealis]|uniref:hypothetical protein n=1 Tax=Actinomyces trachealis TaxID=2763540 RepID=UPI001C550958|nr:hypothetical protein [Actinomyces trachealis]